MLGVRVGLVAGVSVGAACGISADPLGSGSTPGMLVSSLSQSNYLDNRDWSASDLGLGLGNTFAGFNITRKFAGSDTDPPVWVVDRARETLRPSSAGNPNMGPWLTAGRLAAQRGVTEGVQFGISGCEIAKFLPAAAYPTVGPNIFTQFVQMVQAAGAA